MQASADSFDFCIANDDVHVEDDDDISTFESSMGVRRRIDFILCSRCFHSVFGHASSFLDMGSDHRAATSCLQFRLRNPTKQNRSKTKWSEQFAGTILFCTIHIYHICSQVDGPSTWLIFFENHVLEASFCNLRFTTLMASIVNDTVLTTRGANLIFIPFCNNGKFQPTAMRERVCQNSVIS